MKKGFLTNKYTLSVFIVMAILALDIYLHKGMSRVILPEAFTKQRQPQQGIPRCNQTLQINGKNWLKAINTVALATSIDSNANGIEMDLYFDTTNKLFYVYHDSNDISTVNAEEILAVMKNKNLSLSLWVDFKNLSAYNEQAALKQLLILQKKYGFEKRMLVESPNLQYLQQFCDSGFYTSYYIPFFNPYQEDEPAINNRIDSISKLLEKYKVSALSGYYFQMPFLQKFFPAFPLLTWTDDSKISLVNNVFNSRLEKQEQVKIILHPAVN